MLKLAEINNFRTHKYTKLEFVNGINCIVGNPDSGKTNIIRFINWLLKNRPLGIKFHSDFTKDITSGNIVFDNGKISLSKDKKSEYRINDGEPLKAIGTGDVPDEVSQLANMTDLNIQRQLDKPFLICESPTEVAKIFNRITKLEKVDTSISLLTTDINSENKKIKILENQELELKQQIEDLGDIEEMNTLNDSIQKKQEQIDNIENKIEGIEDVVLSINDYNDEINKLSIINDAINSYEELNNLDLDILNLSQQIDSLEDLIDEIRDIDDNIKKVEKVLKLAENDLLKINELFDKEKDIEEKIEKIEEFVEDYNSLKIKFDNSKDLLLDLIDEYKEFISTIKICPFCSECKEPVSAHNLDDILKEYKL